MARARISISSLAIAGLIAVGLSAAPIGVGDNFAPEFKSALAKGKGSGKSGGKGGGKSGSKSTSQLGSTSDAQSDDVVDGHAKDGDGNGLGHVKAKGIGHLSDHDSDVANTEHDYDDSHKNLLGNLNAAHASPTALENASGNSTVGLLGIYARAVEDGTIDAEAVANDRMLEEQQQIELGKISNKSYLEETADEGAGVDIVDKQVVAEVNALLDGKVPAAEEEAEQ